MSGNMNEFLQNSVGITTGNIVQFKNFVQACLEHGIFYNQEGRDTVIKTINNSLNSPFDKEKGLILLQNFLTQISVEAFSSNAFSWMVNCNKIISQKEGIHSGLALKVLSRLLKLSVKFPEVNKEAAKQIVPKFLLDHVRRKSTPQVSVELLECVQACMSEYPGPSGEFRLDIQKLLLSTVEARAELVQVASRCAPLVAGVGGGGKQGVSHKTAWQRQQMALVRLLHSLLNRLYEHIDCQVEGNDLAVEDIELTLESVDERNILTKSQRLATQFTSIALFLQAMLLEEFPVVKSVAPDAILDVVAHAQKPTLATLGSSREALAVTAVLPTVQVAALQLLESLVLCLGRNLVPQGGLVCYLCSQVVHWTHHKFSDWPYAMDKPYSQTRHAAYCCLHSWLSVAGAASQLEAVVDKLLPALLADIHAEKPSVRLQVGSKAGKGRKKQQVLVSQEDRSEKLGDPKANSGLCEQALLVLVTLVQTSCVRLKPDMISSITNTVLRLVADLPVPYSDAKCVTALYQLLLTLCLEPHPRLASPLSPALAVFTAGMHHHDPTVRATCLAALSSLDKTIHPMVATLYFPTAHDKEQNTRGTEDDEDTSPLVKKMRIESPNETQSVKSSNIGDEKESRDKHCKEKQIYTNGHVDSSDSDEIVELVPIDDGAESVKTDEQSDNEEIEIVEIIEDVSDSRETLKEPSEGQNILEGTSLNFEGQEKETGFHCQDDSYKSHSSLKSKSEDKVLASKEDETCEEDVDVSQMLMDFTDEVND